MIKQDLKKNDVLFTHYDNLKDGGSRGMDFALDEGRISLLAGLATSSEGEGINLNLNDVIARIVKYNKTLDPKDLMTRQERLGFIFHDMSNYNPNELWFFFDGSDSGMSINAVIEFKRFIHSMIQSMVQTTGRDIYVIVSANEYEMCDGEQCFDVQGLRYTTYKTYNSYKKAILKSAEFKYQQLKKAEEKLEAARQRAKETQQAKSNSKPQTHGSRYRRRFQLERTD